jgi:bifunctional non-homologous end joining protein LigD
VKVLLPNFTDVQNGVIYLGNLTIPQNADFPEPGDILEVEYRHRFFLGALCQPVYKFARNDICLEECVLSQIHRIKEKSDSDMDEE